jgi:3-oxoacyl-[acyl-carrier protein] reductase
MTVELSIKDKVALVTGARRGLGKAMALAFADAGADLVLNDCVVEDGLLQGLADEIKKMGRRALPLRADISDENDVHDMVNKAMSEFGKIDILVNNAAISTSAPIVDLKPSDWDKVLDVDLKGAFLCSQAAGRIMIKQKSGCIINISSIRAFRPKAGYNPYGIVKAALITLTQQLARELSDYNIRVNAIAPGYISTDLNKFYQDFPDMLEQMLGEIPLGHQMGQPSDIANAALFLVSDAASYITGHTLVVDGGVLSGHPVVPYKLNR